MILFLTLIYVAILAVLIKIKLVRWHPIVRLWLWVLLKPYPSYSQPPVPNSASTPRCWLNSLT